MGTTKWLRAGSEEEGKEHLQENIEHLGVGLLHLVEKHNLPPHPV